MDLVRAVDTGYILAQQFLHRLAALRTEDDRILAGTVLDDVGDQCIDDLAIGRAERIADGCRDILKLHDPCPGGVFDITPDVGNLVGNADDTALERGWHAMMDGVEGQFIGHLADVGCQFIFTVRLAAMAGDAVPHLKAEVQAMLLFVFSQPIDDAQAVELVLEKAVWCVFFQAGVEHSFTAVAKGRMTQVMAERNRLDQVEVESQGTTDGVGNVMDIDDMFHPGADMVILGIEKHLSFVAQTAEFHGENDPARIALEYGPHRAFAFRLLAAP